MRWLLGRGLHFHRGVGTSADPAGETSAVKPVDPAAAIAAGKKAGDEKPNENSDQQGKGESPGLRDPFGDGESGESGKGDDKS
jgi:hypothetical protein